jgi:chlorophyll synthase
MARPALSTVVELLKPITWFAPMWAFACGVVSSGISPQGRWPMVFAGVLLAGPLVCATSQAVNDWFDRHVDAINEPARPIPSGRIPGRWGFYIALGWTALSLVVATALGPWGFGAAVLGLGLAWAYSAPPIRLKRNGWWGNSAVALCYEGLPWFTGAAVMTAARPDWRVVAVAALYSAGAHGIMTLPQVVVVAMLVAWGFPLHAGIVALLLLAQVILMTRLLRDPREHAARYNATGTTLYVLGMLTTACALKLALTASS